jgi:hypothetical protein
MFNHVRIAQNYNVIDALRSALVGAVRETGPIDLLVMWIHDEMGPAASTIVDLATEEGKPIQIVHVLGSGAKDVLSRPNVEFTRYASRPGVIYQQVILGSKVDCGKRRWLTHKEISGGVLAGIDNAESPFIVGEFSEN